MPILNASNPMLSRLVERQQQNRPVRVGVVGTGDYGESLICQLAQIPGAQPSVLCDLIIERTIEAFVGAGYRAQDVVRCTTAGQLADAVKADRPAVTEDYRLLLESPLDVIVDCTGDVEVGCRLAAGAMQNGKHVVMVNVEADITAGAELAEIARKNNVVYTLADGDQPSLIAGLIDWARCLGLEVVSAGKGTTIYPPDVAAKILTTRKDPTKSNITYLDGTKTQIEMAAAANATGLTIDVTGMHGPAVTLHQIPGTLCPRANGGIMEQSGVVDYVNAYGPGGKTIEPNINKGIFVVATTPSTLALKAMTHKGVISSPDGKHVLLHRPFHLVGVETSWSVLRAAMDGVPTACPMPQRQVEVVTVMKRAMKAGEKVLGQGTADVRGLAVQAATAASKNLLPLGMSDDTVLTRDVAEGDLLTFDAVKQPADSLVWSLRKG